MRKARNMTVAGLCLAVLAAFSFVAATYRGESASASGGEAFFTASGGTMSGTGQGIKL
ncbi:MAG: hypothetical protein LBL66_07265 [Clostridiales bacterium]|nr:hypothetical protein [Clostridiales bacterium]